MFFTTLYDLVTSELCAKEQCIKNIEGSLAILCNIVGECGSKHDITSFNRKSLNIPGNLKLQFSSIPESEAKLEKPPFKLEPPKHSPPPPPKEEKKEIVTGKTPPPIPKNPPPPLPKPNPIPKQFTSWEENKSKQPQIIPNQLQKN